MDFIERIFGIAPDARVVAMVTRASAYGVFKPALDSLYTQVDAETRYKTKNFIDTAVWRFGDLAITARNANVTTLTGVPQYVALGLAVSVRLQGERPNFVINAEAAKAEGADFSAELLKLAQIWPE